MRNAHISSIEGNKWHCDLLDDSGAHVSGCCGTSDLIDRFIGGQIEATRIVHDGREAPTSIAKLVAQNKRMKMKLAIKEAQIEGYQGTVDFYKNAYFLEAKRNDALTDEIAALKVGGTRNEGGISPSHKEDI